MGVYEAEYMCASLTPVCSSSHEQPEFPRRIFTDSLHVKQSIFLCFSITYVQDIYQRATQVVR